jgi:hypothetical protein
MKLYHTTKRTKEILEGGFNDSLVRFTDLPEEGNEPTITIEPNEATVLPFEVTEIGNHSRVFLLPLEFVSKLTISVESHGTKACDTP